MSNDGAPFTPLESRLEVVLDPYLTTASLVAPHSPNTLGDNTTFNMTLPDPPLPLGQLTEFNVGESFSVNTSLDEDDML